MSNIVLSAIERFCIFLQKYSIFIKKVVDKQCSLWHYNSCKQRYYSKGTVLHTYICVNVKGTIHSKREFSKFIKVKGFY